MVDESLSLLEFCFTFDATICISTKSLNIRTSISDSQLVKLLDKISTPVT